MKNKIIVTVALIVILVAASLFIFTGNEEVAVNVPEVPPPKKISVYVSGQVKSTAVVNLEDNGNLRAVDAVNAVGGLTEFADTELINLAEPISDGQHIHVPTKEIFLLETPAANKYIGAQNQTRININTADEQELQNIKGVGPAIAKRIVDYREQNGAFTAIEELKKVRGIGNKTFEKMKDTITVQ